MQDYRKTTVDEIKNPYGENKGFLPKKDKNVMTTRTQILRNALEAIQTYFKEGGTLENFEEQYGIRGKTDGNHIILDYDMLKVDWSQPYGYVCRGLILDAHTFKVLCFGLDKFWNAAESQAAKIDWETARIFSKLDGTMVNRWYSPYTERFECSTRYQLPEDLKRNTIGDSGHTWEELIQKCLGELPDSLLQQKNETCTFEVMSPVNRVVVAHRNFCCSLLARRNLDTLQEIDLSNHPLAPKTFAFSSQSEVEAFAETLKGVEAEGFVVVDANFNRVKIKGSDYVRLHHLKDSSTNSLKALILVVRHGEVDELATYFPEYLPTAQAIAAIVEEVFQKHLAAYQELQDIEIQKDFALAVQGRDLTIPGLLFSTRAGKAESIEDAFNQLEDNKFVKVIKPLAEKAGIKLIKDQ